MERRKPSSRRPAKAKARGRKKEGSEAGRETGWGPGPTFITATVRTETRLSGNPIHPRAGGGQGRLSLQSRFLSRVPARTWASSRPLSRASSRYSGCFPTSPSRSNPRKVSDFHSSMSRGSMK